MLDSDQLNDIGFLCFTGASNTFHESITRRIADRAFIVFVQDDDAGKRAWKRWESRLRSFGKPELTSFSAYEMQQEGFVDENGDPFNDLAEFLEVHQTAAGWNTLKRTLNFYIGL